MTTTKELSKSDFVNPDVLNAVNPHPVYGYAHGKRKRCSFFWLAAKTLRFPDVPLWNQSKRR